MLISFEDAKRAAAEYLRDDLRPRLTNPIFRGAVNGIANLLPFRADALLAGLGGASALFMDSGCVDVDALEAFFEGYFPENPRQTIGFLTFDVEEARRLCAIMRKKQEQKPHLEGSAQGDGRHTEGIDQPAA